MILTLNNAQTYLLTEGYTRHVLGLTCNQWDGLNCPNNFTSQKTQNCLQLVPVWRNFHKYSKLSDDVPKISAFNRSCSDSADGWSTSIQVWYFHKLSTLWKAWLHEPAQLFESADLRVGVHQPSCLKPLVHISVDTNVQQFGVIDGWSSWMWTVESNEFDRNHAQLLIRPPQLWSEGRLSGFEECAMCLASVELLLWWRGLRVSRNGRRPLSLTLLRTLGRLRPPGRKSVHVILHTHTVLPSQNQRRERMSTTTTTATITTTNNNNNSGQQ